MTIDTDKLVNTRGLLEALFDERSRPTERWVRLQTQKRNIPYIKLGHLVFFDVEKVREALERSNTIRVQTRRRYLRFKKAA